MTSITEIVLLAQRTLAQNKECFAAQWILQNQDKNISDYELVETCDYKHWETTFSFRKKEGL
jgi:hypothetical protein